MEPCQIKPILVTSRTAKQVIGVGNSKFWQLVKAKRIELVEVGGVRMVVYSCLEKLAEQPPDNDARRASLIVSDGAS